MSEKTTPFVRYYWNRLDNTGKTQCLESVGLGKSAFYYKMKNPGLFSTAEAQAFCEFIKTRFHHQWNIDAILGTISESEKFSPRKPKVFTA